ncbi:MAG: divalent metal cation transporter, partial [Firmicutes bacterium]|nr:divalent metal cation transporter [Bacillota bacterium]
MQTKSRQPHSKKKSLSRTWWRWLLIIGPGVLGLVTDNDAGGMISYLLTGASQHLQWFLPALIVMALITYFIQSTALRIAIASRLPFSQLLTNKFGIYVARIDATILHLLNVLILVTEFIGMSGALAFFGMPHTLGLWLSAALVIAFTSFRSYLSLERLLLSLALINLAFIPALFFLPTSPHIWPRLFSGGDSAHLNFLLLALAGNAISPWMIYWQQN